MVGVEAALDESVLLHELQPVREQVGRDPRERELEIAEPPGAPEQVTHEQERPPVADELERLRHRARLSVALGHAPRIARA